MSVPATQTSATQVSDGAPWSSFKDLNREMPDNQKVKTKGNDTTKTTLCASFKPPAYIRLIGRIAIALAENTLCHRAVTSDGLSDCVALAQRT